jgi:hypothetical protein
MCLLSEICIEVDRCHGRPVAKILKAASTSERLDAILLMDKCTVCGNRPTGGSDFLESVSNTSGNRSE